MLQEVAASGVMWRAPLGSGIVKQVETIEQAALAVLVSGVILRVEPNKVTA